MSAEVPKALLDKLVDIPGIKKEMDATSPKAMEWFLFRKAAKMIRCYGNGDKDEPKKTDTLLTNIGSERISLRLSENVPGFLLRMELLPQQSGGEAKVLDIVIKGRGSKWGEEPIKPDQLRTVLGLTIYLEDSGLSPRMGPGERWQIQQDMKLPMSFWMREWGYRRYGP